MSAARAAGARRGGRRRSLVTLLAAAAAVTLMGGPFGPAPVAAADPPTTTAPPTSQPNTPPQLDPSAQRVENVIAAARQYLGVPYRVGSEGPSLFDCSGLVFRAFGDADLVDRIGGARLRAAGYMRWFAAQGLMTADESQAQRGDLVVYNNGAHIGIYLGDGRAISALLSGVTVHSLHGISLPVTGFLRPDWSGDGAVAPFVPLDLPDVPETPATLVPGASWMPVLDATVGAPADREGKERTDLRTLNSRTFENRDGTFTTEFHAQPIFYQPAGTTSPADLEPIDLTFVAHETTAGASVTTSPVVVSTRPASDPTGFVSAAAGATTISLSVADKAGMAASESTPQVIDDGRVVDYFDFQPQHIGLRVLAQTDGFKSFLVLSKEPDRSWFAFVLDAPGLNAIAQDDGSIALVDEAGGVVGRIPRPLLVDSSDVDGNGGGVYTSATTLSVSTDGPAPVITVAVDRTFLDEAVYPAFVDLSLTEFPQVAAGADVTYASSAHPNASLHGFQRPESVGFGDLWVGRQPESQNDNEAYLRFDGLTETLGTVDVASASLEVLPYLEGAEKGVTTARRVTSDWTADTLTWTTRPASDATDLGQLAGPAGAWASLDVSSYVTDILSRVAADYGLVLASDAGATHSWQRLAASDATDAAEFGPRLVVTWSGLRPTGAGAATAPDGASTSAPTLTWTQPGIALGQARFEVQVSRDGFATTTADSGTVSGKLGTLAEWAVPDGSLSAGLYTWRVRVKYGDDKSWSPWSTPLTFQIAPGTTQPHGAV